MKLGFSFGESQRLLRASYVVDSPWIMGREGILQHVLASDTRALVPGVAERMNMSPAYSF